MQMLQRGPECHQNSLKTYKVENLEKKPNKYSHALYAVYHFEKTIKGSRRKFR